MKFKHIIFLLSFGFAVSCASHSNSEHSNREEGRESGGEHAGKEGSENGEEGTEGEENGTELSPTDEYKKVKNGALLTLSYNKGSNSFIGTVENTTNKELDRVRVEVHLSNGTELGPTEPVSLAAGEKSIITLKATRASFTGWSTHAEVGNTEHGGESSEGGEGEGEHGGEGREGEGEHGGESREGGGGHAEGGEGNASHPEGGEGHGSEANEAAMSSPITPLNKKWKGTLGGLAISMEYDAKTKSIFGTVRNTTSKTLCYVQSEPHLKLGSRTVGEMGPGKIGDLKPGQQVNSKLLVSSEPELANVKFDGYVIHMEIFDCAGSGPVPHSEGGEEGEHGKEGKERGGKQGG